MSKRSDVFSLSFLDVLTCGLGAVLLLFFILMVLRKEIAFQSVHRRIAQDRLPSAFLILATSEDTAKCWDPQSLPWEITGAEPNRIVAESGSNFAVVYASETPPSDMSLLLRKPLVETSLHIQVFADDHWFAPRHVSAQEMEAKLAVWPVPTNMSTSRDSP